MTRIRNVGGKILEQTGGKEISYAKESIVFNSLKKISFTAKDGTTLGKPEIYIEKPSETTTEELVLFFRSEPQAEGFPKRDKVQKVIIEKIEQFKPLEDSKYTQSFGFDFYRPDLYGVNTIIYEDKTATDQTLEKSFDIDPELSLELKNKRGRSYFIDNEFKLVGTNSGFIQKYYVPNLLVMSGKTITLYAKYFCPDNSKVTATVTLSSVTGIDSFTQTVSFSKNEQIVPINISTSATVNITEKTTLSISIEKNGMTKVIGKCNILPNKEYRPNFIFIDLAYNTTIILPSTNNTNLIKDLNEKAFNQVGINIVKSANTYSLNINPDDCLRIDTGTSLENGDRLRNSINGQNEITNFDMVLEIAEYKFHEKIALEIALEIETEFRKLKIKDKTRKEHLLIDTTENLEGLIKIDNNDEDIEKQKAYNRFINSIINFIEGSKTNYFIAFMCNNLESADDTEAKGYINKRGLLVSKRATGKTMTVAHEIGHNFGLRHTFLKVGQSNDLDLIVGNTFENIMDYLSNYTPKKNFISFQWAKMQKSLDRYALNIDEIDVTTLNTTADQLKDNKSNYLKNSNLHLQNLTRQIILSIFNNIEQNRKIALLDEENNRKEALKIISDIIKKTLQKLHS